MLENPRKAFSYRYITSVAENAVEGSRLVFQGGLDKVEDLDKVTSMRFLGVNTVCLRSLDPFYIVTYSMKWVKTYWTGSMLGLPSKIKECTEINRPIVLWARSKRIVYNTSDSLSMLWYWILILMRRSRDCFFWLYLNLLTFIYISTQYLCMMKKTFMCL